MSPNLGSTVGHTIDAAQATVNEGFTTSVTPQYDAVGNMVNDGVYKYSYDAWNRLVKVQRQGPAAEPQVVAEYRYDGLGHRIQKVVSNSGDDMNGTEYYYYNQRWQLLEIATASNQARQQFVWGTRYIDEAICMDVDTNADGNCTDSGGSRHFFHMQDANWNVVGLREGTTTVERYEYDPYGTVRIYRGSATAGAPEQRTVAGQSLKWLDPSLPGSPVLYAGYFQDSETGLYQVRNRMLGRDRWLQRDPTGHRDGANLYGYVRSQACSAVDPMGLAIHTECEWAIEPQVNNVLRSHHLSGAWLKKPRSLFWLPAASLVACSTANRSWFRSSGTKFARRSFLVHVHSCSLGFSSGAYGGNSSTSKRF